MSGEPWLILPTYNEAENIEAIVAAAGEALRAAAPAIEPLVCVTALMTGIMVLLMGLLAAVGSSKVGPPAVEKDGKLAISANPSGQLLYTVKAATATAGAITISMTNMSGIDHNLAIQQGTSANGAVLAATPISSSGTHSITLNLKPGTYTFFCQVPGHRAAGMFGTLTVK